MTFPPGNIWQGLETFLVITSRMGMLLSIQWAERPEILLKTLLYAQVSAPQKRTAIVLNLKSPDTDKRLKKMQQSITVHGSSLGPDSKQQMVKKYIT